MRLAELLHSLECSQYAGGAGLERFPLRRPSYGVLWVKGAYISQDRLWIVWVLPQGSDSALSVGVGSEFVSSESCPSWQSQVLTDQP